MIFSSRNKAGSLLSVTVSRNAEQIRKQWLLLSFNVLKLFSVCFASINIFHILVQQQQHTTTTTTHNLIHSYCFTRKYVEPEVTRKFSCQSLVIVRPVSIDSESMIVWVSLKRTVVGNGRFDNLSGRYFQSLLNISL